MASERSRRPGYAGTMRNCRTPPTGSMRRRISGRNGCQRETAEARKSIFFAIVLARSRYKFTFFARRPFDTELAIYAHECAFEYFGGKPEKDPL